MCLDCGCGELNESHGDSRHIMMDSVQAAAKASKFSVDEAIRNISDGLRQAQQSYRQTSSGSAASDWSNGNRTPLSRARKGKGMAQTSTDAPEVSDKQQQLLEVEDVPVALAVREAVRRSWQHR